LAKRGKISHLENIQGLPKLIGSMKYILPILLLCLCTRNVQAQTDTANKATIQIIQSEGSSFNQTDSGMLTRLTGAVILKHNNDFLYCDTAYIDINKNNLEAYGSVRIVQPGGTEGTSNYLRYIGNQKLAFMRGNVSLTDGKSDLWCEELTYDLNTKIGVYDKNGTLRTDATVVSSREGTYNLKTKDSRFKGNVTITDPEYNVVSEDIAYNTETKISKYYAYSVVTTDKSVLITSNGIYDAKKKIGHFEGRSSIQNESQYIEGDTLDYNKITGFGKAVGDVITIDTVQHTTMYCGVAVYNEISGKTKAWLKPVMKQVNGQDSLFTRADTFFSAPVPRATDSILVKRITYDSKKNKITEMVNMADSIAGADSTRPRYFIAYHNVKIFSDSMQARCDSLSYSQEDSIMRLIYDPVMWSRKSQITGDTILVKQSDSNKIKWLYVPRNAHMASLAGPDSAGLYDQMQGRTLRANFNDSVITDMIVEPEGESIYYSKDEGGAYISVDQAKSERILIIFGEQKIRLIKYDVDVSHTMSPLDKVSLENMKLSRFKWRDEERPKTKEELFE
jgi:lipopolysaccharide export system protein LptA